MLLRRYIKNGQKYFRPFSVIVICTYALYLRLVKLANHQLWGDEYWQLDIMNGSFIDFLRAIPGREYCSYLSGDYYLIYPFFKIFSYNKWGLAIPHIIATIIGFYILYLICKRYFKTMWGYLITFTVVCFNATLINHATEIRTYAVLPTLALAVFYLSQLLVEQNVNMSMKKKWMIGAFFVLIIWFHAYGILILFSIVCFFLLTSLSDKSFKLIFKSTSKFLAIVCLVAAPLWLFSIFSPHCGYTPYNTFKYIPSPFANIKGFLKSLFGTLVGNKKLYFLLIGIVSSCFLPYKNRFKQIIFLIVTVFFPVGLILLSDIKNSYFFLQRQFIWVMPFFAFLLGWSWDSLICYLRGRTIINRSNR